MSLAPHGGMPFSGRPLMTVVLKSSLDSVLSESTNEGPTKPSCSAPWQRSHANARHVFQPSRVLGSTLSPSCTVYGAAEFWSAAWAVSAVRLAIRAVADRIAIGIEKYTRRLINLSKSRPWARGRFHVHGHTVSIASIQLFLLVGACGAAGGRIRQREDEQRPTQGRVLGQVLVTTHGAQALMSFGQPCRHADTGPAADARIHANELLPVVRVCEHVADDPGGRLELPQFLAVLRAHRLDVAFQRAVEGDITRGGQGARPYRETLRLGPGALAGRRIPGDEIAHAAMTVRGREHGQGGAHIGLARRVLDLERLVGHADMVGRNEDQARLRVIARRLLVLGSERGRADVLHVDVRSGGARRVL